MTNKYRALILTTQGPQVSLYIVSRKPHVERYLGENARDVLASFLGLANVRAFVPDGWPLNVNDISSR